MSFPARLFLALLVVGVDVVTFAVPLSAFAIAWVLLARPAGFLHWVLKLYDDQAPPVAG